MRVTEPQSTWIQGSESFRALQKMTLKSYWKAASFPNNSELMQASFSRENNKSFLKEVIFLCRKSSENHRKGPEEALRILTIIGIDRRYIFAYKQYTVHFPPAWDEVGFWCTRSLLFQFCLPAWHSPECCIISVIIYLYMYYLYLCIY